MEIIHSYLHNFYGIFHGFQNITRPKGQHPGQTNFRFFLQNSEESNTATEIPDIPCFKNPV